MKNKICRRNMLFAIGGIVLFTAFSFASAATIAEYRTHNTFAFGIVDISAISELEGSQTENIDPESIARKTTILNKGAPCWIRCANTYAYEQEGVAKSIRHTECSLDRDGTWLDKTDGWYYLTVPLGEDERVVFEETLLNPVKSDVPYFRANLKATLRIEAIQARNFTPNFTSETPWESESSQEKA